MKEYNPKKFEQKLVEEWKRTGLFEPDLKRAKRPFYNLMMFPYPSAEGLHVGNMYAFVGADIYGRKKRMEGFDVFEPIGLDGFGIHTENYALKIGLHPKKLIQKSEKRFYKQLEGIGNAFSWKEKLETYDPEYYKWTQWVFIQMFNKGLACRKKAKVNWCPKCKTVLADEQVIKEECERCSTSVVYKDLEQWFFKITDYAERLLKNLDDLDWSETVKTAQRNWIGKSEGAEINFPLKGDYNYVLLHGFKGNAGKNFFPWLKKELSKKEYRYFAPNLPNPSRPTEEEQVSAVLKSAKFDENTILFGHSLGAVVAMKVAEKLKNKIAGLVLAGGFAEPKFKDHPRPFETTFSWKFNWRKIKANCGFVKILSAANDYAVPAEQGRILAEKLSGELIEVRAKGEHFTAGQEPAILENLIPSIKVFTTRPDTIFGATYLAISPEHKIILSFKSKISNFKEVDDYVKKAKKKSQDKSGEKTGVELKNIKAVNPANNEEIPIWAADYVLGTVGTGAIMAVPAHDQRDFEFAKKFNLPIKTAVCPRYPAENCPVLDRAYESEGYLVNSGKFSGLSSEQAKREIIQFLGAEKKTQYKLRDWLISRQRYWGPPIPLVFCENCAAKAKSQKSKIKSKDFSKGELENPGWIAVSEKDLPVKLPYIKDFKPLGKGKSPLATHKEFYKTKCPKCGGEAERETDVSDTFLDSAWYYYRYIDKNNKKEIFGKSLAKKWLPVDIYIGGAEHAVLHLLYTRFITKFFYDLGLINFDEPFKKFRAHGLLIKSGAKMSKSKGNVIVPDKYIKEFGADILRMYLMFLGPFEQGGDFRDEGILGIERFLKRVWKLRSKVQSTKRKMKSEKLETLIHQSIKKVSDDIENLRYNTAISQLMILLNGLEELPEVFQKDYETLLKLLAPFAPLITEELWRQIGNKQSIHFQLWPKYDAKKLEKKTFLLVISVNGKVRDKIEADINIEKEEAEKLALSSEKIQKILSDQKVKKIIFVKNKLINFVV